jgi:hypothetical protein
MLIIYRISNNSYTKVKLDHAKKEYCLKNFIKYCKGKDDLMVLLADSVSDEFYDVIKGITKGIHNLEIERSNTGSNAASVRLTFAIAEQFDGQIEEVLFQEDDYLYRPPILSPYWTDVYSDGLKFCDYVTLYDHPDKYIPPDLGGNPEISIDGWETTFIKVGRFCHWKQTNSTTMTFATKVKTLLEDADIWNHYISGNHPHDYPAFLALRINNRRLAAAIPGGCTHTEIKHLAPLFDWKSPLN